MALAIPVGYSLAMASWSQAASEPACGRECERRGTARVLACSKDAGFRSQQRVLWIVQSCVLDEVELLPNRVFPPPSVRRNRTRYKYQVTEVHAFQASHQGAQ